MALTLMTTIPAMAKQDARSQRKDMGAGNIAVVALNMYEDSASAISKLESGNIDYSWAYVKFQYQAGATTYEIEKSDGRERAPIIVTVRAAHSPSIGLRASSQHIVGANGLSWSTSLEIK